MKRIRCGVIGLGRLGFRHAANLAGSIPGAELTAVSDVSSKALELFTASYPSVAGFTDYHDVLNSKDIDAVVIASSTTMHAAMITDAINAGKAVFCEKPLSLNLDEALAVQELAAKKHAFVQLGFMRRFDAGYAAAKKKIESGDIGTPVSLLGISRDPSCPPIEFAKSSGGLILDLCVHDFDLCRWFTGSEAVEIYARGGIVRYKELEAVGDIDHVNIEITFANGVLGSLEGSRNSRYGYDVRTEVVCSEGAAFIGNLQDSPMEVMDASGIHKNTVDGFLGRFGQAYLEELRRFIHDVQAGNAPCVGIDDGIAALKLGIAANASLRQGKPVPV
ncbi:Gfo/Idh/MocA family oxidoreductase [Parasphaerochaeta coccoides]|uniref:Inositol 2-dehydrogenase n=1 Tax=Parasphaerochaeta coccoides (strain ATCC BAA-1237 / DSM 17374 / SPN1) TaxID=760011 RepID=F4GJ27_PARC1|nr:Gfo/Idh/MocA family oxidoreductase [Parasphaerochaeta coccoides]AEC01322.1 Inositol 2-dehydrogenase [Parasphaerochaeta coccoides DSM 17374]